MIPALKLTGLWLAAVLLVSGTHATAQEKQLRIGTLVPKNCKRRQIPILN